MAGFTVLIAAGIACRILRRRRWKMNPTDVIKLLYSTATTIGHDTTLLIRCNHMVDILDSELLVGDVDDCEQVYNIQIRVNRSRDIATKEVYDA